MNVHALAVWKTEHAGKSDDVLPVKHGSSSLRTRTSEAAVKLWGGPSPIGGMTRRLKSSHRAQQEERTHASARVSTPGDLPKLHDPNAKLLLRPQHEEVACQREA
jgi:hypothetical protein